MRDAIELRGVLEGTAARFAAERGTPARDLAALRATNETIKTLVHRADYESFERYLRLNEAFHARLLKMARSPLLVRSLEGIVSLPFAGPSAFVFAQAELPASRDILVIAYRHHTGLIDAIERRQGARAESLAREHARLALANLEIVVENREVLDRLPGANLITLARARARWGDGAGARAGLTRGRSWRPTHAGLADRDGILDLSPPHRVARGGVDVIALRAIAVLQGRAERHGHERRAHALDRGVQVVERRRLELGRQLGSEAAGAHRLVGHHGPPGAPHRGGDRLQVQRHQACADR